jgi:hypothetical protein
MFRTFGSTFTLGLAATIVTATLSFAVIGCGSSGSTTPDAGPTACDLAGAEAVLTSKCALSGCHDATTAAAGGLNLTASADLGTRLLGATSNGMNQSLCGTNTTPYLQAHTNPATGLLLQKISTTAPCGLLMPYGATATSGRLTATQINCITTWATTITSP